MGALKDQLEQDITAALKAGDDLGKSTLRMALAALQTEAVAGASARDLTQAEETTVLNREVAKRRDSAEAYTQANRPELAEKELAEVTILQRYLPTPLTDAELDDLVAAEVAAAAAGLGAAPTMRQMGQVIKAVNAKVAGRAEGAKVAAKVKAALA